MNPFLVMIIVIFRLFFAKILKSDNSAYSNSFCSFSYYNQNNDIPLSREDQCSSKDPIYQNIIVFRRVILVSSVISNDIEETFSSYDSVYENFFVLINIESKFLSQFYQSNLIIQLSNETHFVNSGALDENSSNSYFRRSLINITMQPLYCNASFSKLCKESIDPPVVIVLKNAFILYISHNLLMYDLEFRGNDLAIDKQFHSTPCFQNKEICCHEEYFNNKYEENSDNPENFCGLNGRNLDYLTNSLSNTGIFNLEIIFDAGIPLITPPILNIIDCKFTNIWILDENINSLISIQTETAIINIENSKFTNFFAFKGLIFSLNSKEIPNFYLLTEWNEIYSNKTFNEILRSNSYILFRNNHFGNRLFDYNFVGNFIFNLLNLNEWKNQVYSSSISIENINNLMKEIQIIFFLSSGNSEIYFEDIFIINTTNLKFLQISFTNVKINNLILNNICLTNEGEMIGIFHCNIYLQNLNFSKIFPQLFFYFESSNVFSENITMINTQNFVMEFIEGFLIMNKFQCLNSNSTLQNIFYFQSINVTLIDFIFDNFISEQNIFEFAYCDEVILKQGHSTNISAISLIAPIYISNLSIISSYFSHCNIANLIKINSAVRSILFVSNIFIDLKIKAFIAFLIPLIYCLLEQNYFLRITYLDLNNPFLIFQGEWNMIGNIWEKGVFNNIFFCFIAIEQSNSYNYKNSFLFAELPDPNKLGICFWHCFEAVFNESNFIYGPGSFLNGIVYCDYSQKSFFLTRNNFILLNKSESALGALALFATGTPYISLQDNYFANLKCFSSFQIVMTMGTVNIQGASSFAHFSNEYEVYAKNNTFFNCSCLYGGSMSILNYNQAYIEQTNVNSTRAEVLGGFISIFNCYNLTIRDLFIEGTYSPKGSCIYAANCNYINISSFFIENSIGGNSGSIEARNIGLLKINEMKISNSYSKSGSFLYLFASNASISNSMAFNTTSLFYGGVIFVNDFSSLFMNIFWGKNISSSHSGGFLYVESAKNLSLFSLIIENSSSNTNGAAIFINYIDYITISHLIMKKCKTYSNGVIFFSSISKAVSVNFMAILCEDNKAQSGSCIFYSNPSDIMIKNITCINNIGTILKFYYFYYVKIEIIEGEFSKNYVTNSLIFTENILLIGKNLFFSENTISNSLFSLIKSQINMTNATIFKGLSYIKNIDAPNIINLQVFSILNSIINLEKIFYSLNLSEYNLKTPLYFILASESSIYLIDCIIKDNKHIENRIFMIENSYANMNKCLFLNNTGPVCTIINSFLDVFFSYFENNQAAILDSFNEFDVLELESPSDLFTKIIIKNTKILINEGISSCFSLINNIDIQNSIFIGNINNHSKRNAALKFAECPNISIQKCIFFNTNSTQGSSVNIISLISLNSLDLHENIFILCAADEGGAIFIYNFGLLFNLTIISNRFIENFAFNLAAGLCIRNECFDCYSLILNNNSFIKNTARVAPTVYSEILMKNEFNNTFSDNSDDFDMTENVTTMPYALNIFCLNENSICNDKIFEIKSGESFNLSLEAIDALGQKLAYDSSSISLIKSDISGNNSYKIKQIENFMSVADKGVFTFEKLSIFSLPNTTLKMSISVIIQDLFNKPRKITKSLTFFSKPCDLGEIFDVNFKCHRCIEGFYTLIAGSSSNQGLCYKCPEYAICPGGNIVIPESGYWRMSRNSFYFVECQNSDYCIGLPADVTYANLKNDYQEILKNYAEIEKGTCLIGHEKNLCQTCVRGFGKYISGGTCVVCKEYDALVFVRLAGVLLILIVYLLFTSHQMMNFNSSSIVDEVSKIYINHFQRISLIMFLDLNSFIGEIKDFFQFFDLISFFSDDIFSNDCLAQKAISVYYDDKRYFVKVFINYIVPFAITFAACLFFLIKFVVLHLVNQIKSNRILHSNTIYFKKMRILFLIAVFLYYPLLVKCSLSLLNCISLDETDNKYMFSSPNVVCWQSTHLIFFFTLGVSAIVLFDIGFPAVIFLIIKKHKDFVSKLNTPIKLSNAPSDLNSRELFEKPRRSKSRNSNKGMELVGVYRFFYKDYTRKLYYWESIIFLQKFLLTLIQNLNQLISSEQKNYYFIIILVIYYLILDRNDPFKKKYINDLEKISVFIAILTKLFFVLSMNSNISDSLKIVLMAFQLVLNAIFLLVSLYILIKYGKWKATLIEGLRKMKLLRQKLKTKSIFRDSKADISNPISSKIEVNFKRPKNIKKK